jgi:mannose-6-phosphate isomerase-like protein (cupin superfamily)
MSGMSYPPVQYSGDGGQVSGAFRPASQPPELSHASGGACHYLATGAGTGGEFGLYRWEMGSSPSGPGAHFHRTISESFFVLSGEIRLYDGGEWRTGEAGDFLYVPPGGIHAFRNESGEAASMLILFTPGAPREDYFETLSDAVRREALSDDAVAAEFYLRHDTYWT